MGKWFWRSDIVSIANLMVDFIFCRHYSADLAFSSGGGKGSIVVSEFFWISPFEVHAKLRRQAPANLAVTNFRRIS